MCACVGPLQLGHYCCRLRGNCSVLISPYFAQHINNKSNICRLYILPFNNTGAQSKKTDMCLKKKKCITIKMLTYLCLGNHPEDPGHPQSALDVLFWSASQQRPIERPGALAPSRYGRFPRQRKIWTGTTERGVEVRGAEFVYIYTIVFRQFLLVVVQVVVVFPCEMSDAELLFFSDLIC